MNNVKKYKFVSSVAIAIAVVLVIVVNVFVSVLNNKLPLKIDLTSNKMYELSDKTKEYLKNFLKDRYAALDKLFTVGNSWTD